MAAHEPPDQSACRSPPWCLSAAALPSELATEVIAWVELFKRYLVRLSRHFIDWQERPAVLERFPLHRYPFDQQEQRISHDQLLASLQAHQRLLLIDAEKRREILPQTLPALLRGTRANQGITQAIAADQLGISLATYKSWERGKVFPNESKHIKIKHFLTAEQDPSKA